MEAVLTSEEYAKRVQAVILSAGARMMEREQVVGCRPGAGLYSLAMGGADAVRGKGREHEADSDTQAFERPTASCVDWLAEVRDELTDAAAWMTGANEISKLDDEQRDRYVAVIAWHLAHAIDALDGWIIWERQAMEIARSFIRPEEQ